MGSLNEDTELLGQCHCPMGVRGRTVAALMNRHHNTLSTWGLNHVQIEPNFNILDVGCGGGKTISKLANQADKGRVFGIDYSRDMVAYSRQENKKLVDEGRIQLVQCSVDKLSFQEELFDLVTAIETYYFWSNLQETFNEIKRVLKPTGTLLIISEMIKDGKYEIENAQMIVKSKVKLVSLQQIKVLLYSAGFFRVEILRKTNSSWNVVIAKKP